MRLGLRCGIGNEQVMDKRSMKTIRGYELGEIIGAGGFGAVHRAYQPIVEREVAIKVILPEFANNPSFIRNFEAEARMIAHLEHPFIVPLFDYWREPDGAYLVMRFFPAGNLKHLLEQGGLPVEKVVDILGQLAGAMDTAHRHQVIHRDIKPENILMDEEGNAYIADFGIAKQTNNPINDGMAGTESEGFSGTLAYAAPELLTHESATAQSDIYSLGYVVYEMLTGKYAFADESPVLLLLSLMDRELPAIAGLPEKAMLVLLRATAKDPSDRYTTARAMANDFQQAVMTSHQPEQALVMLDFSEEGLVNPYKGLRPFDEADAGDFFGRDDLLKEILNQLSGNQRWHNFLAVVGPSGSGKSSVIHAGLLPALRAGKLPDARQWYILSMTPGARPLQQLRTALLSIAVDPMDTLSGKLRSSVNGLTEAIDEVLQIKQDLFLVIDQFEEVFTLVEDEAERRHFLDLLYAGVTHPASRLRIVITLRADFYDKPLLYENFGALVQARTQVVLPLNSNELEQAITGPATRTGLEYDSNLLGAVIADVRQEPGALPLLQYALTEVFEHRTGNRLTLAAYQDSGRILGALARRAEDVYTSLRPDQQAVAAQIFLRLVAPGEGTEDTRRRARFSELTALKIPRSTLQSVLDAFEKYRLLTFDRDSETREPTIEVAHEALIRGWARLRGWFDQNRSDIRLQRLLAASADDWRAAARDKSYLLSGTRLAQFEEWAKTSKLALSAAEQEYLDASFAEHARLQAVEQTRTINERAMERRSRRRLQLIAGILTLAAIVGSGLTLVVFQQKQLADQQANIAKRNALEANSYLQSTRAQQALDQGDTINALSLALAAATIDNPPRDVLDTLINVAYAPGLRRIAPGANQRPIAALAISPDGHYALSGSGDSLDQSRNTGGGPGNPPPPPNSNGNTPATPPPVATVATTSSDTLILWDVATGRELRRLQTISAAFVDVIFQPTSADKPQAISAANDGTIIVWDVLGGQIVDQFNVPASKKITLSASADGGLLLIVGATQDQAAAPFQILWDIANHHILRQIAPPAQGLWTGHLMPDGKTAISAYTTSSGTLQIVWDVQTGATLSQFGLWHDNMKQPFYGLDIRLDGKVGVLNVGEPDVVLWDTQTNSEIKRFQAPTVTTLASSFSQDGSKLLITAQDGALRLWDVARGTLIRNFVVRNVKFSSSVFSANGRVAITGTSSGSLYFWDIETTPIRQLRQLGKDEVIQAAFLPNDQILTFGVAPAANNKRDSQMIDWDLKTGKQLRTFGVGHLFMPMAMAISPDSKFALTGTVRNAPGAAPVSPGTNDSVIVWNIQTGENVQHFETNLSILSMAFEPHSGIDNQLYLAAIPQDFDIGLRNTQTGEVVRVYKGHSAAISGLVFSPDGRLLAATGHDGKLILWATDTGTITQQIVIDGDSPFVTFSADGGLIAITNRKSEIVVLDSTTLKEVYRLHGHENRINSFVFSADGRLALSSSFDNTFILWDTSSQQIIHRYDTQKTSIWQVAFSPDQKSFLSASNGLIWWRFDPNLEEIQAWVKDNRYLPAG